VHSPSHVEEIAHHHQDWHLLVLVLTLGPALDLVLDLENARVGVRESQDHSLRRNRQDLIVKRDDIGHENDP
jgi:hypothetical protein